MTTLGDRRLVLDKLCSTLTTFFIQAPITWNRAVRHLVASLFAGSFVPSDQIEKFPDVTQLFPQLSAEKQVIVLRFCQFLAEEMFSCANLSQQQ